MASLTERRKSKFSSPLLGMFPFLGPQTTLQAGDKSGEIIAVCALKGGVGKTTTAVHLAAGLALKHRVLLIDADPQGHAGSCLPPLEPLQQEATLATQILKRQFELLESCQQTANSNLDVVFAGDDLAESEGVLSGRIGKEGVLRSALKVTRTHYDYVVIDCPPSLSTLAVASLTAARWVLIPCELAPLAVRGLRDLIESLQDIHFRLNQDLNVLGIVANRVDARNKRLNADTLKELKSNAGDLLFRSTIRSTTALSRAQSRGTTIFSDAPKAPVVEDYKALLREVRKRIGSK